MTRVAVGERWTCNRPRDALSRAANSAEAVMRQHKMAPECERLARALTGPRMRPLTSGRVCLCARNASAPAAGLCAPRMECISRTQNCLVRGDEPNKAIARRSAEAESKSRQTFLDH